mmetsp:Transcript_14014/g.20955  ORF Transcript_14014/g.20955 Transcript_14014/m.20955 type:complete len:155 (+) Transcript_14014:99-563(+)|eukprot:CAMPEP_0185032272 /NCGR_PEP_ID=MMETSP1103-20130426/20224_1 /TAXON_ID=36769 /ORGANISM="Paraphysomonas bandaiensis, Strain Caron Lab Isolate" /LENGTH=154 /DNA_ID=CAMNT_0027568101 /DNA_START=40 /DNA_END=504 /DNA_ORIENTATION=+
MIRGITVRKLFSVQRVYSPLMRSFAESVSHNLDEMLIITKSCAKRINELRKKSNNDGLILRLAVDGGGCSGFQYAFSMESDDTLSSDDKVFTKDGATVVVDESSFELVKGSTVDYEQELIKNAFAVVNNPQSESACGCGSSFALKAFSANPAID